MKRKIIAFSLIELTIGLVIMGALVAAFAPTISKNLVTQMNKITGNAAKSDSKLSDECETISPYCKLCDVDKTKCVECDRSCPEGKYKNINTCTCVDCCDNCASIIPSSGYEQCKLCTKNWLLDSLSCSKCSEGYYLVDGICVQCPAGSACSDGINKEDCSEGTYASGTGNTSCLPCEGCDSCNIETGSCVECDEGYYASGNSCAPCPYEGCATCTSTLCKTCKRGYILNAGLCTACTDATYSLGGTATECLTCTGARYNGTQGTLFTINDGTSTGCANSSCANCATCDNTSGVCQTCASGYHLDCGHCCAAGTHYDVDANACVSNGQAQCNCHDWLTGVIASGSMPSNCAKNTGSSSKKWVLKYNGSEVCARYCPQGKYDGGNGTYSCVLHSGSGETCYQGSENSYKCPSKTKSYWYGRVKYASSSYTCDNKKYHCNVQEFLNDYLQWTDGANDGGGSCFYYTKGNEFGTLTTAATINNNGCNSKKIVPDADERKGFYGGLGEGSSFYGRYRKFLYNRNYCPI